MTPTQAATHQGQSRRHYPLGDVEAKSLFFSTPSLRWR